MKARFLLSALLFLCSTFTELAAQCSITNATSCACRTAGATNCELLPDIQISWYALANYASGPSEYAQSNSTNPGRLRVSGSTPNQGYGPLEVRGVNAQGYRTFICGPDTITIYAPADNNGFTCPNGYEGKQRLYQRVYQKNGNAMTYTEELAGTMTYHPTHNHYHVDDWTTMTLRIQQPGITDPRQWPIISSGGKLGFCLMDLSTCPTSPGHCRTSQEYNQGTALNSATNFPNYGLGIGYTCSENFQGISVGKNDIYSESLDGMWINILQGTCNGNYWIVAEVDPRNAWREENDENNWTAIPFSLTQQNAAGSGGGAGTMMMDRRPVLPPGGSITLTATAGYSYLWSTGATTRSITVTTPGDYSCAVTAPCGQLITPTISVTQLDAPAPPAGTGATVVGPSVAQLSATGDNVRWFDSSIGGTEVGVGNDLTTPLLSTTTNYWAEARSILPGVQAQGAKADNSGGGGYVAEGRVWTYFDAYEPFKLVSVKVYSNLSGKRYFVLRDRNGNLLQEKYVELPVGQSTVTLNWDVPQGENLAITAFDDNSDVYTNLYRNNAGVSYPYSIGSVGSITGSSQGPGVYYYLYDWSVKTDDVVATSARTMVTATVTEGVVVDLKALLQGPYNVTTGLMSDSLRVLGLIPSTEPFTAMGFTHAGGGGGEVLAPLLLNVTGNDAVVDWVLVELRSAAQPSQVLATKSCLLTRNGQVIAAGGGLPRFAVMNGSYHVAIRHRNHLGCMTASPLTLGAMATAADLRLSGTATFGNSARRQESNGMMVLWAGNVHRDDQAKYTGENNDRDPILNLIGGIIPTNTVNGYLSTDTNMDGVVKYTGGANDRDIILNNIGGVVPTQTRTEQLP